MRQPWVGGVHLVSPDVALVVKPARRLLGRCSPTRRGCTAGLKPSYMMEAVSQMTRALYNRAVVAAHDRLLGFRSRVPMLAAETKVRWPCARHAHGRSPKSAQRWRDLLSRRLAGGGQHGRGLWAWCWSFLCWLHGPHGLPRCSLYLRTSFMCPATRAKAAPEGSTRTLAAH